MTQVIGLQLEPLDTLFFRDGRPFTAATRGEGGLPQPRTLAGALRSNLVRQFVDLSELPRLRRRGLPIEDALRELKCPEWVLRSQFRGPWLAQGKGDAAQPLVPMPVILSEQNGRLVRLRPLEPRQLPGWSSPHELWPLWRAGASETKPAGGFLSAEGLREFLDGHEPSSQHRRKPDELFAFEERTGLAIHPDRLTGVDSMLYGIRLLVLKPGVSLYAEVIPGDGAPTDVAERLAGPLPLGGEGRHVSVQPRKPFAWPQAAAATRSLWLLTTPAPLREAHRPDVLPQGCHVRAAATAAPIAFSGWDVARNGPERTRFAVPAGAVYFVEGEFTPDSGSFCAGADDVAVGWGLALRGVWQ